jgi:hypothetical protein
LVDWLVGRLFGDLVSLSVHGCRSVLLATGLVCLTVGCLVDDYVNVSVSWLAVTLPYLVVGHIWLVV